MTAAARLPLALARTANDDERAQVLVRAHHGFVWRSLRRLGVPEADVDDAAQGVFLVALAERREIENERGLLFAIAARVAANARRKAGRVAPEDATTRERDAIDPETPESILDRKQLRALLDEVLDALPDELRAVFVLYELEELTTREIAALLEIAPGTVASRLRRARELVDEHLRRRRARLEFTERR